MPKELHTRARIVWLVAHSSCTGVNYYKFRGGCFAALLPVVPSADRLLPVDCHCYYRYFSSGQCVEFRWLPVAVLVHYRLTIRRRFFYR